MRLKVRILPPKGWMLRILPHYQGWMLRILPHYQGWMLRILPHYQGWMLRILPPTGWMLRILPVYVVHVHRREQQFCGGSKNQAATKHPYILYQHEPVFRP